MLMNGKLEHAIGDELVIKLDEPFNPAKVRQYAVGKSPSVSVEVADGRKISPDQRKKIWALINDYALYTGYAPLEMEQWVKVFYMADTGSDYFSLSDCSMSKASAFLTALIDFGFEHDIPWQSKNLDAIPSDYPLMMQCLKHRKCVICGKHADIDHEPPIGSGRDRNHIDNRRFKLFPLCREHHVVRHQKGIEWFMSFYHIKPVKLDAESLISLKLNTRKQFEDFDRGR